ncbi:MAG: hypothetical protein BIFFINMI_01530 [Phycisphaerae bacterium]|nr:hypothetical protein [Phycisphaerae bacterium]
MSAKLKLRAFDSWQRVCPATGQLLEPGSIQFDGGVRLRGGRGEFASFQIVLGPFDRPGRLSAEVSLTALRGRKASIAAGQYDLLAEWYVHSGEPMKRRGEKAPKPGPAAGRFVPDLLVPLRVYDGRLPLGLPGNQVPGQRYQGLWVDLFIPADTAAGSYSGRVKVEAGGQSFDLPVELEVDRYRAGDDVGFTFMMNNYCDSISSGWPALRDNLDRHRTALYRRVERSFWRVAHDHRCVFYYLPYTHSGYIYPTFAPPLTGGGPDKRVASWTEWDRHFGGYFDGSAFKGTRRGPIPVPRFFLPMSLDWPASFLKWDRPGYADEFKAVMGQMAAHFKAKGWTKTTFDMFLNHKQRFKLYPWDCEEVRFLEDNEVHYKFRKLWEGTLDHKTTRPVRFDYTDGTTWVVHDDMRSAMSEFLDVYICSSTATALDQKLGTKLRKQGRHFCLCGGGASMADSLRATAFWPLQLWVWGGDSFMVWLSMEWGDEAISSLPSNGRLTFLYPGHRFGLDEALPSLRLKTVRDVLQTIGRLEAALGHGADNEPARRQAARAMGMPYATWFPKPDPTFSGSEEKPAAGWARTTLENFRALADKAIELTR